MPHRGTSARLAFACVAIAACAAPVAQSPAASRPAARREPPKMRFAQDLAPTFAVSEARRQRLLAAVPEVDRYLQKHFDDAGCPAATFGVVLGEHVLLARGYGARDPQSKAAVDEHSVFRIGSVTKTFTGTALLLLRDEGRVDLDEPIATYLPEAEGLVYPTTDSPPITVRHLLTHTSGLPRVGRLDYTRADREVSERDVLASLEGLYLESVPGVRASYSNLGFALAGLVIERVSGQRYREFVGSRLLAPVGMSSTVWDQRDVPKGRLAVGYELRGGRRVPTPHWRMGAAEAMGGAYASLADMLKYASFQLSAWPPRDAAETGLLRRNILRASHVVGGEGWSREQGTGVAWAVKSDPALGHLVAHAGSTGNYASAVRLLPERQLGVVGLCSTGDAPERLETVTHEVLAMLVRRDPEPARPLSGAMEAAMKRLELHLAAPKAEEIQQTFAPAFLAEIPAAQLMTFFTDAKKQSGACTAHRGVSAEGLYSATVHLSCERQSWRITLKTTSQPPFRIEGMWFNPAAGRD